MTTPSIGTQHSSTGSNANTGLNPTFQNAAAAGDTYLNTGKETLLVKNSGPSSITAIITAITACNQGFLHSLPIAVPSGTTPIFVEVGPLSPFNYSDVNRFVEVGYSTVVLPAPGAFRGYASVGTPGPGVGTYKYAVTFVNATGETTGSVELTLTTTAGNQVLNLEGIPIGPAGTTKRGLYRTNVNGASRSEKLALYLNDNATTSFVDTIPDAVLGAAIPTANTAGIPAPGAATLAAGSAGTPNGTYRGAVTFVNAAGETTGGAEAIITVSSSQINWSNIPIGPAGTTARKLYRTKTLNTGDSAALGESAVVTGTGGGSGSGTDSGSTPPTVGTPGTEQLVTTIADNASTTFTDNVADASLGATIPATNTASVISVAVTAP